MVASSAIADNPNLPVEIPSVGNRQSEYIDERGCVYQRAKIGGWDLWVQRVDKSAHACGFPRFQRETKKILAKL